MHKKITGIGMCIGAIAILLTIGWTLFSLKGKQLQLQYFGNSYIATDAIISKTTIDYFPGGRKWDPVDGMYLTELLRYTIDGVEYTEGKSFILEMGLHRSTVEREKNAEAKAQELYPDIQINNHVTIYVEPGHPKTFELDPEEQPHFWFIFLVAFPVFFIAIGIFFGGIALFQSKKI